MLKQLALLAAIGLSLSACQTTIEGDTPKTTVESDGVKVTIGDDEAKRSDGTFCPPGQAKKGRC